MFTVVKLGGCNGSGKTTLARAVMELCGPMRSGHIKAGGRKTPNYYVGSYKGVEVVVLGNYETVCGGMDTISDKLDRLALLNKVCKPDRIVFYEGLITGKTYGAMGALSETHVKTGKGKWLYTFMDTPFQTCVDRVLKRRHDAGNGNPFDPERTMRPTYDSCDKLARKLRQEVEGRSGPLHPHPVHMVSHKNVAATEAEVLMDIAWLMQGGK